MKKGYFANVERKGNVVVKRFRNRVKQKHAEYFKEVKRVKKAQKIRGKIPITSENNLVALMLLQ